MCTATCGVPFSSIRHHHGKLNNGIMVFVDIFLLEIYKQWLKANMRTVLNEISLNTPVHEM